MSKGKNRSHNRRRFRAATKNTALDIGSRISHKTVTRHMWGTGLSQNKFKTPLDMANEILDVPSPLPETREILDI